MLALHQHAVGDLHNLHRRVDRKKFDHHAFVFWIKMLDQHKGHAAVRRQGSEQLPECVEAACGGSERNDGESILVWLENACSFGCGRVWPVLSRPSRCHCRSFRESGFHEGNACDLISSYHKRCNGHDSSKILNAVPSFAVRALGSVPCEAWQRNSSRVLIQGSA
jgi:hypothetical protein